MSISVDLTKSTQVVVDLTKEKGISGQKAQVVLAIDYSISMTNLYRSGIVQKVIERLVPIAMAFDDNASMEVYRFENGCVRTTDVTARNLDGYVAKHIDDGRMGGTNYAPAIKAIVRDHPSTEAFDDTTSSSTPAPEKKGFFAKLFSSSEPKVSASKALVRKQSDLPTYVIFITDGENSDTSATEQAMIEASYEGVFFQFVGISDSGHSRFPQLEKLDDMAGRLIDNANFFQLSNKDLTSLEDKKLYDKLLTEFPDWLKLAKTQKLIK